MATVASAAWWGQRCRLSLQILTLCQQRRYLPYREAVPCAYLTPQCCWMRQFQAMSNLEKRSPKKDISLAPSKYLKPPSPPWPPCSLPQAHPHALITGEKLVSVSSEFWEVAWQLVAMSSAHIPTLGRKTLPMTLLPIQLKGLYYTLCASDTFI